MKKKNIVLGLAVVAALNVASFQPANAGSNPFATVPQSTGYYQDVAALVHDGLIDGYADSDFKANRPLTRYEMAVFTAKAMSNSNKANAADTQRIQKLMKAFQSELTDMHVAIPGVKAKKADSGKKAKGQTFKIKKMPENWNTNGLIRYRYDTGYTWKAKDGKHHGDESGSQGGAKNHMILWQWFNQFNVGGKWTGRLDFMGAKDGDGNVRSTGMMTTGLADFDRAYLQGPFLGGTFRLGRDKGNMIGLKNSVIGDPYHQGVEVAYNLGSKWKADLTWAKLDYETARWASQGDSAINMKDSGTLVKKGKTVKVDYAKMGSAQKAQLASMVSSGMLSGTFDVKATTGTTTLQNISGSDIKIDYEYYKQERGGYASALNPAGCGVHEARLLTAYSPTNALTLNMGYYYLYTHHKTYENAKSYGLNNMLESYGATSGYSYGTYRNTNVGEIQLSWQASPKVTYTLGYAQSDWKEAGGQNKAYALTGTWGKAAQAKAHSRQFEIDLVHAEQYAGIKSDFDVKNKEAAGEHGFILRYQYVPVKNIKLDWRWMHYKLINTSESGQDMTNQYRMQLYYYF